MLSKEAQTVAERLNNQKAQKQAEMDAKLEPWRKAADARRAGEQQQRQEDEQRKAERLQAMQEEQFDRKHKIPAKLTYLRTGGSQEDFEKKWPQLREQIRTDLVVRQAEPAPRRNILT